MADLNLGHPERCRGDPLELELAQLPVAAGHPALPSVDDEGHVGLVVMHSGEDLLATARDCQGRGDEHVLLVAHHGNAHRWPLLWQLPALEHVLVCSGACSQRKQPLNMCLSVAVPDYCDNVHSTLA